MKFKGLERPKNMIGIRNIVLVMAIVDCTAPVAWNISQGIKGSVPITQHHGCTAMDVVPTLVGVAKNPNIAGTILLSMGCEGIRPEFLKKEIAEVDKPVELINIQKIGGTKKAISYGREIAKQMIEESRKQERKPFDISKLVVGLKCGGSDPTSSLASNPALGIMTDMLIDAGARVIMTEPIEALGAEELLAKRAVNNDVRNQIFKYTEDAKKRWTVPGAEVDFMCHGNIEGGLTTIEEKSFGAILKGGHRPIEKVLKNNKDFLEPVPSKGGFYLQEGTAQEPMAMSHIAAAGAHVIVLSTGRGAAFGSAICPMIKVTGNPDTWSKMAEDMDINASSIMKGEESVDSVGKRIFNEVISVASGKLTLAEQLGLYNFSIWRFDPRLESLLGIS